MISYALFFISWAIVAWGQPHISLFLSVLSSSVGFALFFLGILKVSTRKRRILFGVLWFFSVQLVQLSWVASPTYQGIYIYFVYLFLALFLAMEFGALLFFLPAKGPLTGKQIFGLAGLWTVIEWSRLFLACGFAWNPIGLSLTGVTCSAQLASVGGIFVLSFLVLLTNLFCLNMFFFPSKKNGLVFGGLALFPYVFGQLYLTKYDRIPQENELRVALIQTALYPDQKNLFFDREEAFVHPFFQWDLILTALDGKGPLDLIVLPEYAVPFSASAAVYPYKEILPFVGEGVADSSRLEDSSYAEYRGGEWFVSNAFLAQGMANHYGAEVVIGLDLKEGEKSYNAAFHFIPQQQEGVSYKKRILVPLAEYLPFSLLRPLVATYGITDFFTHGKEPYVTEGKLPLSLSVCYEECFPHLMREGRSNGGEIFVNVTNDGWFSSSRLPEQHFYHGRVRAIENGAFLLRACNTGVTAAVDPFGRIVAELKTKNGEYEEARGALIVSLPRYSFPTLYSFWGDTFILFLSLLSLLIGGNPLMKIKGTD